MVHNIHYEVQKPTLIIKLMQTKIYIKHAEGVPKRPIIWTHETHRVDIHTGEELTKHEAKINYKYINTDEHIKLNPNKTRGHITRISRYQRKAQLNLFE